MSVEVIQSQTKLNRFESVTAMPSTSPLLRSNFELPNANPDSDPIFPQTRYLSLLMLKASWDFIIASHNNFTSQAFQKTKFNLLK